MPDEVTERVCKRMYYQAMDLIHDSDLLTQSGKDRSSASAFLGILAFEILLKCVLRLCGTNVKLGHDYRSLWAELSNSLQQSLLSQARTRLGWNPEVVGLEEVLDALSDAFVDGRYEYDIHKELNQQEFSQIGKEWDGAPEAGDIAFYTLERRSLIYALRLHIESQLGVCPDVLI